MEYRHLKVIAIIFAIFLVLGIGYTAYYISSVQNADIDVREVLVELEEKEAQTLANVVARKNEELLNSRSQGEVIRSIPKITRDEYDKKFEEYVEAVESGNEILPPNEYMLDLTEEIINSYTTRIKNAMAIYDFDEASLIAMEASSLYDCNQDEDFMNFILNATHISIFSPQSSADKVAGFSNINDVEMLSYIFSSFETSQQRDVVIDKQSHIIPSSIRPVFLGVEKAGLVTDIGADRYFRNLSVLDGLVASVRYGENTYSFYFVLDKDKGISYLVKTVCETDKTISKYADFIY